MVEETLDFLLRDMFLPEGGFASALDADTLGEEGTTYVWTIDELNDVLEPDEAELVIQRYGLTAGGNFEGSNVLFVAREVDGSAEALAGARRKLLDARSRRPQPAGTTRRSRPGTASLSPPWQKRGYVSDARTIWTPRAPSRSSCSGP